MTNQRHGLTLIEVIVAMLLFSVGALGMAAASGAISKQMALSLLRSRAAMTARTRDEQAHAVPCASISSGSETRQGIESQWTVAHGSSATIDQTIARRGINALETDHFLSAIPCG
jgi:prepilin-type N-terminal cleavage/methylation domain-containing protein